MERRSLAQCSADLTRRLDKPMNRPSRVFGFSLLSGFAASVLLLVVHAFDQGPWHRIILGFISSTGLLEFGFLLVVAVLPASLPMTIVGGGIAARVVARQQHRRPLRFWVPPACAAGFGLAVLGSALWFGGINATYMWNASWTGPPAGMLGPSRREMAAFVLTMGLVGGIVGMLVGGVVGMFCWYTTRELPPNDALQLTSGAAK